MQPVRPLEDNGFRQKTRSPLKGEHLWRPKRNMKQEGNLSLLH